MPHGYVPYALICLLILLAQPTFSALDPDKAAEISRYIRDQFRETGMNWVSPKMLQVGELFMITVGSLALMLCMMQSMRACE